MAKQDEVYRQFVALDDAVWRQLGVRKYAVGRQLVGKAVAFYVGNWPIYQLGTPQQHDIVQRQLVDLGLAVLSPQSMGKDRRYGFIWTMLLSAVLSQIVAALLRWWLESDDHRESMRNMRVLRRGK